MLQMGGWLGGAVGEIGVDGHRWPSFLCVDLKSSEVSGSMLLKASSEMGKIGAISFSWKFKGNTHCV